MKIAVDCRYYGKSGIGRVCQGLLENLDYFKNEYYLIGNEKLLSKYPAKEIISDYNSPFSFKGILKINPKINKLCDVFLAPNYLIPLNVKIPVYSVMHDLIFLDRKDTCKGTLDRLIKKIMLKRCMKKSVKVACVSGFTLNRCVHYYGKLADKCFVNYNGLSENVINFKEEVKTEKNGKELIFVGNVKPHKGIKTLIAAFKMLPEDYVLKIIGEKDNFNVGLSINDLETDRVIFTGRINDEELLNEISKASFLIQPSEYEGFGLPPLESLYLGTKPIISDIEVFKEIYDGFDVCYFKVGDPESLKNAILSANPKIDTKKEEIIEKYNYKKFADNIVKNIN